MTDARLDAKTTTIVMRKPKGVEFRLLNFYSAQLLQHLTFIPCRRGHHWRINSPFRFGGSDFDQPIPFLPIHSQMNDTFIWFEISGNPFP